MSKTRLEKWNEPRKAAAFVSRPDDPEITAFVERRLEEQGTKEVKNQLSEPRIIALAKELIFDIEQERPMFHVIMPLFNMETFEIEIGRSLQVELKFEEETPGEIKEDVKRTLALADSLDVSVYPNREELAPRLAQYHRDLLIDGFKAKDESGKDVTLVLTNSPGASVGTLTHLKGMGTTQFHSPAEVHLVKETALAEIETREEAGHILAYLNLAIEELSSLLGETSRNENRLQRCLTRNPILFGTDYRRVLPKHRLGAEYEMDYALERVSGIVDLVEIEASTHRLFTSDGNPRQELVHAEQQVLDWLDWIERHNPYARDRLPGLLQPLGYVVIGRSWDLSDEDQGRLRRRNVAFRGTLEVLTYDDLLERANNLLRILKGQSA